MSQVRGLATPFGTQPYISHHHAYSDFGTVSMSSALSYTSITPLVPSQENIRAPTPGTIGMDSRGRKHLMRSARKLSRVLGEPLTVFEEEMPELTKTTPPQRSRSLKTSRMKSMDEPHPSLLRTKSSKALTSAHNSAPSSPRQRNLPALKVDCNFARRSSQDDVDLVSPCPSTASSVDSLATAAILSPLEGDEMEARRTKMAKLARHLGEIVPTELVFPTPTSTTQDGILVGDGKDGFNAARRSSWVLQSLKPQLSLKKMRSTSSLRSFDDESAISSSPDAERDAFAYVAARAKEFDITPKAATFQFPSKEPDGGRVLPNPTAPPMQQLRLSFGEDGFMYDTMKNPSFASSYRGSLDSGVNDAVVGDKKSNAIHPRPRPVQLPLKPPFFTSNSSAPSTPTIPFTSGAPFSKQNSGSFLSFSPPGNATTTGPTRSEPIPSPPPSAAASIYSIDSSIDLKIDTSEVAYARRTAKLCKFFGVPKDDMPDTCPNLVHRAQTPPPNLTRQRSAASTAPLIPRPPIDTHVSVRLEAGGILKAKNRLTLTSSGTDEMKEMLGRLREMKAH